MIQSREVSRLPFIEICPVSNKQADFDPEEIDSGISSEYDSAQTRQHYVNVGLALDHTVMQTLAYIEIRESKLRKRESIELGPSYAGKSVRWNDLINEDEYTDDGDGNPFGSDTSHQSYSLNGGGYEDESGVEDDDESRNWDDDENETDGNDSFGDGDDERLRDIDQATRPRTNNSRSEFRETLDEDSISSLTDDHPAESERDRHSSSSDTSELPVRPESVTDRAALRKMMESEQHTVVANLSREVAADVLKGKAVLQQQAAFAALLNCRIRLHKALTTVRDIASLSSSPGSTISSTPAAVESAQLASLALWNSLNALQASLHVDESSTPKPRKKANNNTLSTPHSLLLSTMQSHESSSNSPRRSVLSKWSVKTAPPSTLRSRNKFSTSTAPPPFLSVLDSQLSDSNISSQLSRSFIASNASDAPSRFFDDTPFYTTLLRELVSQKSSSTSFPDSASVVMDNGTLSSSLPKLAKQHRTNLDNKASKGRKIRYTVHEKLQNFMPREDRGSWGDRQVDELFGGLLGRKIQGGLEEPERDESPLQETEEDEVNLEVRNSRNDSFKLF